MTDALRPGTYRCAACGGVFNEGWLDEEARAEALALFGKDGHDPSMVKVCDDCFRAMDAAYDFKSGAPE